MPGIRAGFLAVAVALLISSPASAQEERAPDTDSNIVVTGRTEEPTGRDVSRQARAITQTHNVYDAPLARFEDRLCPGVIGLLPQHAAMIIDRIRYHAEQLGMWLTEDDGTCSPNLIVAFVTDGKAELAAIEDEHPDLFQDMQPHEVRELLAEDGPVRVWTTVQERTRDGAPVPRAQSLLNPPVVNMWMAHSKIYLATRRDIASVIVLFDLQKMKGKTLTQLADYATMRGLARTRPVDGEGQPMDTILALFDGDAAPPSEMTTFDHAYLAALYDGIPNIPGITKVLGVNRQLRIQEREAAQAAE